MRCVSRWHTGSGDCGIVTRTSVQRAELGKSEAKERYEERGGVVQEFYEVIV